LIEGKPLAPAAIERTIRDHFHMPGWQGLAGLAMAGIDMAAWDALAKAANLPLAIMLGGEIEPIPTHGSLFSMEPSAAAAEAEDAASRGFTAIKVKVGRGDIKADLDVIKAIRSAVGSTMGLMVDYNQCLSLPEAMRRIRVLDEQDLVWIEEPTRADDFEGHAAIARESRTPIQLGENWWGLQDAARSIAAKASDHVMFDVMRIGGVSGWLRAAALASASGLPVTSHLFPEFSSHLLAVTPTRQWLESYIGVGSAIQKQPIKIEGGYAFPQLAPGVGIEWNEDIVGKYLVE
jgi:mandelate racemase